MANPQPTDSHLRIAHTIWEAIMLRSFSKRQINVLLFILRLSWGCNKKYAIIPRKSDFGLVGVGKTHINAELEWLVASKIIEIKDDCYFFNKDFDQWQVSRVKPYEPNRVTELVTINIKNGYKSVTELVTTEPLNVTETVTDVTEKVTNRLPKRELNGYQKGNFATPELASAITRDINIDNNNKEEGIDSINTTKGVTETVTSKIFKAYADNIEIQIGPINAEKLSNFIDRLGDNAESWILDAIAIAAGNNARRFSYIEKILLDWESKGYKDTKRKSQKKEQSTHNDGWA